MDFKHLQFQKVLLEENALKLVFGGKQNEAK
jgi:hypothetical protein